MVEWSFLGNKEHFCGEIITFDNWSPLRALSACGQILQKHPGNGQTSPPPSRQCLDFGNKWFGSPSLTMHYKIYLQQQRTRQQSLLQVVFNFTWSLYWSCRTQFLANTTIFGHSQVFQISCQFLGKRSGQKSYLTHIVNDQIKDQIKSGLGSRDFCQRS